MRTVVALAALAIVACSPPAPPQTETAAMRHYEVRAEALPQPYHSMSASNPPRVIRRPKDAKLVVPPGFTISIWADDFQDPRNMVLAPNGDVLVADMAGLKVHVLRGGRRWVFADDLNRPFGLAFRGKHLYVGVENAIVRFDYEPGQTDCAIPSAWRGIPRTTRSGPWSTSATAWATISSPTTPRTCGTAASTAGRSRTSDRTSSRGATARVRISSPEPSYRRCCSKRTRHRSRSRSTTARGFRSATAVPFRAAAETTDN